MHGVNRRFHSLTAALRRALALTLASLTMLGPLGCVNQQEYDKLFRTNRALEQRNVQLQQRLEEQQSTVSLLRDRIDQSDQALAEARDRNSELNSELLRLKEDYRQLSNRLSQVATTPLDPSTDQALRDLAEQFQDIIVYDQKRGMLRFKSDLTFALGSTEVTSEAQNVLRRLAGVLAGEQGRAYDAMIIGHTDNVPIRRPQTKAKHPTNMHLSVHRSIAVRDVLVDAGVTPTRIQVAGWGPFRPAVPNPPQGGAAANRRVEIFLVPTTADQAIPVESDQPQQKQQPEQAAVETEEPMK